MRKLVTMLTLAALLFSMVPIATHEAEAASITVLSEDFQNTSIGQVPTGWVATATPNVVSVVQDTYGNRSLSTTENSNGTANMATYNFASPITTSFSVDLRAKTSTINSGFEGYFFALKNAQEEKVVELLFFGNKIARRSGANDKTTVLTGIAANQWYNIHIDVNMINKQYSVTIDGTALASNIAIYTPTASSVSQYSFSSYRNQTGTISVDDLVIVKEDNGQGGGQVNQAPTAVTLNVNGTPALGNKLTGDYSFNDTESDPEGTSVYKWYRGTQANGSDKTTITNAVYADYTIVAEDIGKYVFFGVTPIAEQGTISGTHVVSSGVYVPQPPTSSLAGTVTGNTIAFDSNHRFLDELSNFSQVFSYKGTTINSGSAIGMAGDFSYYSGASDFKSMDMEVTYNKWTLNFTPQNELSVYEAVYNSQTGTFENGKKVTLLRKLRPELMSGVQYVKATYTTAEPITPGTKYLRVILPQATFYGDTATAADFKIDQISIQSSLSTTTPLSGYVIDDASSFSMYTAGSDTSNLQVVNPSTIADIRTFGTTSYIKRRDTTNASMMTYAAPAGKDFKNAYVEGYYFGNLPSSPAMELWTSTNGIDFTLYNIAGVYKHPAFGSLANNSIPDVVQANYLPPAVKYVRVKLIGNTGNGFPYLTKMAFGYGTEVPVAPIDTDIMIKRAAGEIVLDGVVETDAENGNPIGEWAGSELMRIAGVTDNNGDKHSADIYFKYDERKLYLGAKIKDPTPMINTKTGTGIWNGDVLELFMGAEDLDYIQYPDKKGTMLPTDIQLVLGSGIDFGYQSYMSINGVNSKPSVFMELKKDTDGKGYTMEVAIPLHALGLSQPWTGKPFILNAFLSDGGFASRGQWGWTINGEQNKKVRGNFGKIAFEPTAVPVSEMNVMATVDPSTQFVTVSGQTYHVQDSYVTMAMQNEGGVTIALDQTTSDEEGNFAFQFDLSSLANKKGSYTVKIGGQGIQVPQATAFTVGDANSTLSAITVSFDKNVSKQADLNVDMTLNGNTLTAIKNGTNVLIAGTDYVVNGTRVVLSKSYLARLPLGGSTLSFEFSAGTASALTLLVVNTTVIELPGTGGSGPGQDSNSGVLTGSYLKGSASYTVASDKIQVSFPTDAFSYIGQKKFEIKSKELSVSIPPEVFKQVAALTAGTEWKNAVATFNITPLTEPAANQLQQQLQQAFAGNVKLGSKIHNFELTLTSPSGKTLKVTQFDAPITLRLKLDGNTEVKWAALYYISDNGQLSYIGGQSSNGEITAELPHFSQYGVLELQKDYSDVPAGHWAASAIRDLTARLILSGTDAKRFEPDRSLTRAEFTALLVKALHLSSKGTHEFTDVVPNSWYAESVSIAVSRGIVQGKSATLFEPNAPISRQEMVVMFMRAFEKNSQSSASVASANFADQSQISSWAVDAVNKAFTNKWIQGRANGKFEPLGHTTRAEAAQVIVNLFNAISLVRP
ncbi:S-layer homology domain-containing protein [Paenibacillus qinlingensis]|uniref:S-layer homology domain-containing protein n=1 Tax=Paenibacillus qinlingensis TaxID=1837343 RepID=UPI0015668AFA|nr:S-layer homology domain-containing protein [Paenibacillus qinlingensis]NQX58442.1 S-layer homology domain-containing protein [Paenibacillus qinlingensis]